MPAAGTCGADRARCSRLQIATLKLHAFSARIQGQVSHFPFPMATWSFNFDSRSRNVIHESRILEAQRSIHFCKHGSTNISSDPHIALVGAADPAIDQICRFREMEDLTVSGDLVRSSDGEAKFWLVPTVYLADSDGFDARTLRELREVVAENKELIERAWNEHFT